MNFRVKRAKKRPESLASSDPKMAAALLLAGKATLAEVAGVTQDDLKEVRDTVIEVLRRGMLKKATELMDTLDALGDDHPILPFLRAECLEKSGDVDGSIKQLRVAIDKAEAFSDTSLVVGACAHLAELEAAVVRRDAGLVGKN